MIQNEDKLEIFIKKYQKHIFFYLILFLFNFIIIPTLFLVSKN